VSSLRAYEDLIVGDIRGALDSPHIVASMGCCAHRLNVASSAAGWRHDLP
jgi:hypothetical protein